MKKIFFITALILIFSNLPAQSILLEQDVAQDTIPPKQGPNLKHFSHFYFGYGFVVGAPEGPGAAIRYINSNDFNVGIRYKRKFTNFYALGFDLNYGLTSFNLRQDADKILPNNELHRSEKLNFNHFGLVLYNRFNFGKRGNHIGRFLDIGAYGNWEFVIKHIYTDRHPSPNIDHVRFTRVTNRELDYTHPFNYGLQARIGINRYVLYGSYRLSDQFKPRFGFPELPRIILGLQIGLHG